MDLLYLLRWSPTSITFIHSFIIHSTNTDCAPNQFQFIHLLQFPWPHPSPRPLATWSWRALAASGIAMAADAVILLWETPTFSVSLSVAELWHYPCYAICDGNHVNLEPRLDLTRPMPILLPPTTPQLKWSPKTGHGSNPASLGASQKSRGGSIRAWVVNSLLENFDKWEKRDRM